MLVIIYHNPRCSKSRATLALLRERGVEPQVIRYLDTPPDAAELGRIARKLGLPPRDMLRTGENVWKELGLDAASVDEHTLLETMAANPILIERPIVVVGDRARIGRPPEQVLELLG
ncbi:MAG: arsenate reductase (glutaredoxin), partial [Wenzhouxiangellaceae bacterium]